MDAVEKIKNLLENEQISYQLLEHNTAYTALEVAEAQHLQGRQMAKAVIVEADRKFVMCVLSAIYKIDLEKLKRTTNSKEIHLANEEQISKLFPGYEIGAMPPFGQLAGLKVYVDKSLEENDSIAFNAGTHTDVIRIRFKDFVRLVNPTFADFGMHI
jgi:Ala-tRNA(Pro) deacylase